MPPPEGEGSFRFSTDDLLPQHRAALWREVLARQAMRTDSEAIAGAAFRVDMKGHALAGLIVAGGVLNGVRDQRTRELIADGNDQVTLLVNVAGALGTTLRGRDGVLRPGDGIAFSAAELSTISRPDAGRAVGVSLPRRMLEPLVPHLDDALTRLISPRSSALRMLNSYVSSLVATALPADPGQRQATAIHVTDLVALALGASRDAIAAAEGRGVAAARWHAIRSDIMANLGDPKLTIGWLAARQGVSPRYIQMLFEVQHTTFTDFLLFARLDRLHTMLIDPRHAARSIGELAAELGFADPSYFSRVFRRRFHMTPSELRDLARRQTR